jgi:ketosteroid isomerase-like protein
MEDESMKADAQTEAAVLAALNKITDAYAKRNLANLMTCFAPDSDVVLMACGAKKQRVGLAEIQAQAEHDWVISDAASFDFHWTSVSAAGPVAWLAAQGSVDWQSDGRRESFPVFLTAVLEQRGDQWLFVQWHGTAPE